MIKLTYQQDGYRKDIIILEMLTLIRINQENLINLEEKQTILALKSYK